MADIQNYLDMQVLSIQKGNAGPGPVVRRNWVYVKSVLWAPRTGTGMANRTEKPVVDH